MIPHSSAGGQSWGHPLRTFNGGPGRVDNAQMLGQYDQPDRSASLPQPPIRQPVVVDLTAGGPESQDREPPPKRPRLDVPSASHTSETGAAGGETRSTPGSAISRPAVQLGPSRLSCRNFPAMRTGPMALPDLSPHPRLRCRPNLG